MTLEYGRKTIAELPWEKYPIRTARRTKTDPLDYCQVCQLAIYAGDRYYDGGETRRAHTHCVLKEKRETQ